MRLAILLTAGPLQYENWETAALDRGHEVVLHLAIDGVYAAARPRSCDAAVAPPHQRLAVLVDRGARVYVCGTAAELRGLGGGDYDPRVTVGGLPDLAMLLGDVDRLVSL
jgi:sulfur relay (sulfurtransferase) complex TusBCD TusD component (DsrE family)